VTEPDAQRVDEPPRADELLELLHQQHALYKQLHQLARQQRKLVAAEDPTALLNILSERQKLIDELAAINARLEPVRSDWRRIEQALTTEQRKTASLVEQVGQMLAEILAADEADSKTLSARKAMAGRKIRTMTAGAEVQAAYRRGDRPATGAKLDQSSD